MSYIIQHNRSAVAVHDRDLKYIYVSQRYLDEYQVNEQDIIGKHHYDVFPDLPQKWRDIHQRALAGEICSAEDDPYPREDGTVEWTRWECRPWYEADDAIGGIIVYTEVITSRKEMEQALKKSMERMAAILHNIPVMVAFFDSQGKYEWVNRPWEEILGWSLAEAKEKELLSEIYPDPVERQRVLEFIRGAKGTWGDFKSRKRDGQIIDTTWANVALSDGSLIGIGVDITGRKRMENDLLLNLKKLRKAVMGIIEVTTRVGEMRDPYTAGHQHRVAELSRAIAREMDISPEETEGFYLAATVHDIGKIAIPAEILVKPSRLTDIEFMLIKNHPQTGYNILKDVDLPWNLADMVHQHHERMDGSGYPRGLKGNEILLGARIMAVADSVEAMATHRPYRPSLGIDAALDEINKNKGTMYDPEVVVACLRLFHEKGYQLKAR